MWRHPLLIGGLMTGLLVAAAALMIWPQFALSSSSAGRDLASATVLLALAAASDRAGRLASRQRGSSMSRSMSIRAD